MPIDEKLLIRRYTSGDALRVLAHDFGITPQTIYAVLKRNGVEKRSLSIRTKTAQLLQACHNGAIISVAAKHLDISESTATRILRRQRAEGSIVEVKKGRPSCLRPRTSIGNSPILTVRELSEIPFPFPQILADDAVHEFKRLCAVVGWLDEENVIRPRNSIGIKLCAPFFPNRFKARSSGNKSAFDAWQSATEMERAVRFQLDHGDPVTPARVLRAITLRCRTPSIFRPAVAKFIYERYCPKGGRVWDPCSGYGGRLLGAVAAGVNYTGTDVDNATIEGNKELARIINANVNLYQTPAEEFDPPNVDLVFTSPPYFDREKYSQGSSQSWNRYGTSLDTWLNGFLRPVVERAQKALLTGNCLVINIADLKRKGVIVPLVAKTISIACANGFKHVETLKMPLGAISRKNPTEPVLVFRKI